jgi:hypothetical protein
VPYFHPQPFKKRQMFGHTSVEGDRKMDRLPHCLDVGDTPFIQDQL